MLEAIRFINCQSFEDVTINFATDKANILVADNNTGKSILFKMLKVTASPNYYSAKKRSQLIRRGSTNATMVCGFSDGSIGMTVIYSNVVIYRFKRAEEEQFTNYTEPPLEYLSALGLIVDERTKFIANIVDTDQDMLLVNSDQKGNDELLSLLATNSTLLEVKDKVTNLIKMHRQYNSELIMKQSNLAQTLSNLETEDVATLEYNYKVSQLLYEILVILADAESQIEIIETFCSNVFNYSNLLDTIDLILEFQRIKELLHLIKISEPIDESLIQMINLLIDSQKILSAISIDTKELLDAECVSLVIRIAKAIDTLEVLPEMIDVNSIECAILCKQIQYKLNIIQHSNTEQHFIESDCNKLLNMIATLGKNVACPIYGEVIYNGKECVPYNI